MIDGRFPSLKLNIWYGDEETKNPKIEITIPWKFLIKIAEIKTEIMISGLTIYPIPADNPARNESKRKIFLSDTFFLARKDRKQVSVKNKVDVVYGKVEEEAHTNFGIKESKKEDNRANIWDS